MKRIGSSAPQPALIQVTQDQQVSLVDLASFDVQKRELMEFPDGETTFGVRGLGPMPPLTRDIAKSEIPLRTLAIQVIPIAALQDAKVVDHTDFERGGKLDLHPVMLYGPVGEAVIFTTAA